MWGKIGKGGGTKGENVKEKRRKRKEKEEMGNKRDKYCFQTKIKIFAISCLF
jgi:hypothetical protein